MSGRPRRPFATRPVASALAAVLVSAGLVALPAAPASALGETLAVTLTQIDGTASWDADSLPGHDSSATNGIVRTNDNITYGVQITATNGTSDNTTIKLELPRGVQFDVLPALCTGAGSSLSPASIAPPANPLTATSWLSLPIQTLTCNVGQLPQNATRSWNFVARVRPEVPNGTQLPTSPAQSAVVAQVTSNFVTTPTLSNTLPALTVSARAQYDLSKNSAALTANAGEVAATTGPCTTRPGVCLHFLIPLMISAKPGGKGLSPLASPITITDDLSPAVLFAGTAAAAAPASAGASIEAGCGAGYGGSAPYNKIGVNASSTALNSVRDSGTVTCSQPGGPGTPVTITINNADTTAYTWPTLTNNNTVLPGTPQAWVVSTRISYEIPSSTFFTYGTASGTSYNLSWRNTYTNFNAVDLSGQPNYDPNSTWNDYQARSSGVGTGAGSGMHFAGVPNAVGNVISYTYDGPAGFTGPDAGTDQLAPGGQVIALNILNNQSASYAPATHLVCNSWDNTKLQLSNITATGTKFYQYVGANGVNAWLSGLYGYSPTSQDDLLGMITTATTTPNYKVQYGTGIGSAATSTCTDASSPAGWFDDPALVPGNDPALAAAGTYTAVTRVRMNLTIPYLDGNTYVGFSIGLRAANPLPGGTILPLWMTDKINFANYTMAQSLATTPPSLSTYVPTTNTGNQGDRLTIATAVARVTKFIKDPSTGGWVTTTPQYAGGTTVDYRLSPTLTSGSSGTADVVLEDCLPTGENYLSSSVTPTTVQAITASGMPSGSTITCTTGQTYVRWDLAAQTINSPIPPITYTVKLSSTIVPGTYVNTSLITVDGDSSTIDQRTSTASVQVVQPMGLWLDKTALTPLVEVNRSSETNLDHLQWQVDLVNIEVSTPTPTDVDVIDVLPRNGFGATNFSGTLSLTSVTVTDGSTATQPVEVLYTKAPGVVLDPANATNDAATGIAWCTAPPSSTLVLGTGACPTSLAEVTGLRVRRPGTFPTGTKLSFQLAMLPVGNAAGNVYDNQAAGRSASFTSLLGPINATELIQGSSIGDYVWFDRNGNGLQDASESPVPNFPVKLSGTDTDGNAVSLTTTTNATGKYLFQNLQSGTYTVTFDPAGLTALGPEYYFTSKQASGADRTIDSDGAYGTGVTPTITLAANSNNTTIDQGIADPSISISKQVCTAGTTCDPVSPSGWAETATIAKGSTARWRIVVTNTSGVPLSNVTVTDPLGVGCAQIVATLAATAVQQYACGGATDINIDPNTASVTAKSPNGGTYSSTDTASVIIASGTIGNRVFLDTNRNGIQDAGDTNLAGVVLNLTGPGGATVNDIFGNPIGPKTTAADGTYQFTNVPTLPAGEVYTVTVDTAASASVLAPYVPTLAGVGTDRALDSSTGSATSALTTTNQVDNSLDFGYVTHPVSVGDRVWVDTNRDGLQSAGEPGKAGVTVTLRDGNGTQVGSPVTTDADGLYRFDGLVPSATYTLTFTLPSGHQWTLQDKTGTSNDPVTDNSDSDVNPASGVVTFTAPAVWGGTTDIDNPSLDAGLVSYNLTLTKELVPTPPAGPFNSGLSSATYKLTPANAGPTDALPGWTITDLVPAELTITNVTGSTPAYSCSYDNTTHTVVCTNNQALAAGVDPGFVIITTKVNAGHQGPVTNTAYITPAGTDVPEVTPLGTAPVAGTDASTTATDNDASVGLTISPTWALTIEKIAHNCDTNLPTCQLPGAVYQLYTTDPTLATSVPVDGAITTDAGNGALHTTSLLPAGEYWLIESKAPTGFGLLPTPIHFTLDATGIHLTDTSGALFNLSTTNSTHLIVSDVQAAPLPKSGGDGPWPFVVVGLLLMAAGWTASSRRTRVS